MQRHAPGPEHGTLAPFEDRGWRFQEEEGLLGPRVVQLFDVVSWAVSAGGLGSLPGVKTAEGGVGRWCVRVVPSDADDFAAIGRDAARGHSWKIDIQSLGYDSAGFRCDGGPRYPRQ